MKYLELNNEIMKKHQNNFFQLEKDQEALALFLEEVDQKTWKFPTLEARFNYLLENHYYDSILGSYTLDEIKSIYPEAFTFKSFMAASKFYKDYALKTDDGNFYLEHYEDRVVATALYLAQGDIAKAKRFVSVMIKQTFQLATPTFLNAGRSRRGELVSCFLLEMNDSLNSIGFSINAAMQLSKIGGGVALNLSKLRARGEAIKGIENAASGVLPVMKLLEDAFSYANQLGQRKGAGATYLNIFHYDVLEFLDTKKINSDEKSRMQSLSIGLTIPDKFFELAKADDLIYTFAPHTVYQTYGKHLDDLDMTQFYDELIAHPQVKKRKLSLTARGLLIKIASTQLESGYPYLMFKDHANKAHPLKNLGQISMSNLCTEIFQLQELSEINDYDQADVLGKDISCNLGSLNIVHVMEDGDIQEAVHIAMEALTAVTDLSEIRNVPTIKKANDQFHSVGLGAMNLHGYLAKNQILYDSEEAKEFVRTFFMMVNYYSLEKSMLIAKTRQLTFTGFEKSDYASGEYFHKYESTNYAPQTKKVQHLLKHLYVPSPEDWMQLKKDIQTYGLYHAYRLAIAPTQSISYIQNATSSVMPIVDMIESRTYANATTYYPMPYLSPQTQWYYKSAYQIDPFKLLDLIAEIQEHIDQGISTILYVDSDISTRQLARYYIYAHHLGLKSLYYTRTRHVAVEDCLSCSV